jgi:hypothetical protein
MPSLSSFPRTCAFVPSRSRAPRAGRAAYLALILALASSAAHALTTRCVDTVAELNAAVRVAENDAVRVNIVQGDYDVQNTALDDGVGVNFQHDVTLVGGYASGCTSRAVDAAGTTLRGGGDTIFQIGSLLEFQNLTLRSLTLRDFDHVNLFARDHDLQLERVRVLDSGWTGVFARHIRILTSAFTDAQFESDRCALDIGTFIGVESIRVENSLVTGSSGDGLCINPQLSDEDWGVATIENSILWGNAGDDLVSRSASSNDVALRNNVIGTQTLQPASSIAPVAISSADPLFVNPATGDFRLQLLSPAKDTGTAELSSGLPAQDIAGLPRVVAGTIDRGPHENQNSGPQFNYTVSTVADAGAGSLRQAMLDAEANPGLNGIVFNIPGGGCPKAITLGDPLPSITQDLVIDGGSQSGSSTNNDEVGFNASICVVLEAEQSVGPESALTVADGAAPSSTAVIRGLAFSGFSDAAIDLRGGGGHLVTGNRFGGSAGAMALRENGFAVRVTRLASPALIGVQIGGREPSQRNLIGDAVAGVVLNGSFVRNTQVLNNFIGLAADGSGALPNGFGVLNTGAIDTTLADNWISGNTSDGVYLNTIRSYLQGNHIGLRAVTTNGIEQRGNGGWGVRVANSVGELSGNVIGSGVAIVYGVPAPTGSGNVIAYNQDGGIRTDAGLGHRLSRNRVYANDGIQIDTGVVGPNGADDNDAAPGTGTQPNRGLNDPFLQVAFGSHESGDAWGVLSSRNGVYRIELYSDTSCAGGPGTVAAARVYHGGGVVTIDDAPAGQNGSAEWSVPLLRNGAVPTLEPGRAFVALAIDADGNTSELSSCAVYELSENVFRDGFEE